MGAGSSEPAGLVDDVLERLAGQEAPAVVEQDLEPALVEIRPVASGVRRDEHAGHRPQGGIGGEPLPLENLPTRPPDPARAGRPDEGRAPRPPAPPRIYEKTAPP